MACADTASNHLVTLKSWTRSAEHNRIRLRHLVEIEPHGCYRVRLEGNSKWIDCDSPPSTGAAEWLFLNKRDIPLLYWNTKTKSVVLI
jgi:hypothetical protein